MIIECQADGASRFGHKKRHCPRSVERGQAVSHATDLSDRDHWSRIRQSRKPTSSWLRLGCWSLRTALASICRMRSRVTLKMCPTSSSV